MKKITLSNGVFIEEMEVRGETMCRAVLAALHSTEKLTKETTEKLTKEAIEKLIDERVEQATKKLKKKLKKNPKKRIGKKMKRALINRPFLEAMDGDPEKEAEEVIIIESNLDNNIDSL